jgi:methylamine dehydrogenase accessory protein MauD
MDGIWLVAFVALWVIVLVEVVLLLGLTREVGALHARVGAGALMTEDGLDIGEAAPGFNAVEIQSGHQVSFIAESGRNSLVLFIAPNCDACRKLISALAKGWARWQRDAQLFVVCEGEEKEVSRFAEQTKAQIPLLLDRQHQIHMAFGQPPTPFAFLVGPTGAITLKGVVHLGDDIDRLIGGQARALGGREVLAYVPGLADGAEANGHNGSLAGAKEEVTHGHVGQAVVD